MNKHIINAPTQLDNSAFAETRQAVSEMLDRLITMNRVAIEGYKMAAELIKNKQFKEICRGLVKQRERFIVELMQMTNGYNGIRADSISQTNIVSGSWVKVRGVGGGSDCDILSKCERVEAVAIGAYEAELSTDFLPLDVETLVRTQLEGLKVIRTQLNALVAALA